MADMILEGLAERGMVAENAAITENSNDNSPGRVGLVFLFHVPITPERKTSPAIEGRKSIGVGSDLLGFEMPHCQASARRRSDVVACVAALGRGLENITLQLF